MSETTTTNRLDEIGVRPTVVCLCGSTRFRDVFVEVNRSETMAGHIVLAPGVFGWSGDLPEADCKAGDIKTMLDDLHFRKIDLADEVFIVNVRGYIGESTRRELAYAIATGKPVRWLEPALAVFA